MKEEPWIQTFTGKRFYPLAPRVEDIDILDIAHALSMQCRFSGHTLWHYSVAQHSVMVSMECASEDAKWGLLHDAAEAYLVDLSRPLKKSPAFSKAYARAEDTLMIAICYKFGLPLYEPASVKEADKAVLATEARQVLCSPLQPGWEKWGDPLPGRIICQQFPSSAEAAFLGRFRSLFK